MKRDEREQLAEAMELIREFTEAFRQHQQMLDYDATQPTEDRETARQANDRAYGDNARKYHRGGQQRAAEGSLRPAQRVQDAVEDWAAAMNAYGRWVREGKK